MYPSDKEYIECKQILRGERSIDPGYKRFADWFTEHYGVKLLNVYYEKMQHSGQPRLQIIVEYYEELQKARDQRGHLSTGDNLESELVEKFALLNEDPLTKDTRNMFVIFSAFTTAAREECNTSIPQARLDQLISELNIPELWKIARSFSSATFFVYTEKQVEEIRDTPLHEMFAEEYFSLLKEYDEFDYWRREGFSVAIDSKENFDNNYKSNWYYYFLDH